MNLTTTRTALAGIVATTTAVAALALGAVQASAAPATGSRVTAVQGETAEQVPGWVLRGKYWQYGNCVLAGNEGIQRGHWDQFQCASGALQWVLWTNR
ncbi:hypothetical protein [Streptomyces zingiberis]|uniref:Chitin-binding type-3 domain-containing protein n=1 Tax=Streptomyces zingiberis TaxID=2053010 RepID=A0ABX1BVY2_9ACTN|nr:hypothetical protein [Streptomyces zingiberis]NJQ01876.1 hypothetical protein [Streptomyces zingiberis]